MVQTNVIVKRWLHEDTFASVSPHISPGTTLGGDCVVDFSVALGEIGDDGASNFQFTGSVGNDLASGLPLSAILCSEF